MSNLKLYSIHYVDINNKQKVCKVFFVYAETKQKAYKRFNNITGKFKHTVSEINEVEQWEY